MPRTKGAKDKKPRKRRTTKEPTKVIRVPVRLIDRIKNYINKLLKEK